MPGPKLAPEFRKLVLELVDQGWTYEPPGKGRARGRVVSPDGAPFLLPNGHCEYRAVLNARSTLRHLGANV